MKNITLEYYEWQLMIKNRWLRIDGDHVIETHYCQPGAKGMTINTTKGKVFIDFDTLETSNKGVRVQRLSVLPPDQTEDVCWYFRDEHEWWEYGSRGPGTSVSSRDIERHFTLYPQGNLRFTVGSNGYSLDFRTMTQMNLNTGLQRRIRRRPKFTNSAGLRSPPALLAGSTSLSGGKPKWEFMDQYGKWTEYQKHNIPQCNWTTEHIYNFFPQITVKPIKMVKKNNANANKLKKNQCLPFKMTFGFNKQVSISSEDIEVQFKRNPYGLLTFTTKKFKYELDFAAMTQRNLSTNTVRSVRRLE
uniref:WWE domain-containing protein n=1 Tax=Oryzias melastigma TaxID=30732 RepID=A0A3B3BHL9_ORYME